jgi:hypothetical protein
VSASAAAVASPPWEFPLESWLTSRPAAAAARELVFVPQPVRPAVVPTAAAAVDAAKTLAAALPRRWWSRMTALAAAVERQLYKSELEL